MLKAILNIQDAQMITCIKMLDDKQIKYLIETSKKLTKNWWLADKSVTPTERAIFCIPYRIRKSMRQKVSEAGMSKQMVRVWRSRTSRLKDVDLPETAKRLGVSLHWLNGSDSKIIYTNSELQEELFDLYKLLPSQCQTYLFETTKKLGE